MTESQNPPGAATTTRPNEANRARRRLSLIGQIALGTLLAVLLLTQMSFDALWQIIQKIGPGQALLSLVLLLVANVLRAARLRALMPGKVPFPGIYRLTVNYNLLTGLLPAALGELYLPLAAERVYRVPYAQGVSLLFITRLLDLVAVAALLVIGAVWVAAETSVVGLGVLLLFAFVGALLFLDTISHFMASLAERIPFFPFLKPLARFVRRFADAFRELRAQSTGVVVIGLTIAQWVLVWMGMYAMLQALGLPLSLGQAALGMGIVFSMSVIPLSGVANFGIREVGWALVLALTLDLAHREAVAGAFAIHLITLVFLTLIWFSGFLGLAPRSQTN